MLIGGHKITDQHTCLFAEDVAKAAAVLLHDQQQLFPPHAHPLKVAHCGADGCCLHQSCKTLEQGLSCGL